MSSKNFKLDNNDDTAISEINKSKIYDDRNDELLKEDDHSSSDQQEISSEDQENNSIRLEQKLSADSSASGSEFLKDEIYAASKFGDTDELIRLLEIDGFEIEQKNEAFSIKSKDGEEKTLSNNSELISLASSTPEIKLAKSLMLKHL